MKVSQVRIQRFKRFTDLTIQNLPPTAKLILLVGPNGCGKTSLFEAFNLWYRLNGYGSHDNKDFYIKKPFFSIESDSWARNNIGLIFHDFQKVNNESIRDKFYFRTAYRNEPDFIISGLNRLKNPLQNFRLSNLSGNDLTVSENYQRLLSNTLSGVFERKNDQKTIEQLRSELIGSIRNSLSNVFEDLNLFSIGDPLENGSFYFEKGASIDFHYKNLSSGEKSAFDLILDLIIKSSYYPEAIFCIDEPEAHMHTRLQSNLLKELLQLIPDSSQLWLSTHSLGMIKTAREIEKLNPGSVVFLDFDNRDFDGKVIIEPSKIDKITWNKFIELAFDDFPMLLAPSQIVFCEGSPNGKKNKNFDANIYTKIFEDKYPDTTFISVGSTNNLENLSNPIIDTIQMLFKNTSKIFKVVDRDDRNEREILDLKANGINVLSRRHIECFLWDEEIVKRLCSLYKKEDKIPECLEVIKNSLKKSNERGNPIDDYKSASGDIYVGLKRILNLTQCGNDQFSFFRDTIAPLITEETYIYKELEKDIFNCNGKQV